MLIINRYNRLLEQVYQQRLTCSPRYSFLSRLLTLSLEEHVVHRGVFLYIESSSNMARARSATSTFSEGFGLKLCRLPWALLMLLMMMLMIIIYSFVISLDRRVCLSMLTLGYPTRFIFRFVVGQVQTLQYIWVSYHEVASQGCWCAGHYRYHHPTSQSLVLCQLVSDYLWLHRPHLWFPGQRLR